MISQVLPRNVRRCWWARSLSAALTVGRRAATRSASTVWVSRSGEGVSVWADSSPAGGEVPEQHQQAGVDAWLVDDRHVDGEVAGAFERAGDEPSGELGVARESVGGALVEDRDAGGLERAPAGCARERWCVGALPGSEDVAFAE